MKRNIFAVANLREAAKQEWLASQADQARRPRDDAKAEAEEAGTIKHVQNAAGIPELEIRGYVSWPMVEQLEAILEDGEPDRMIVKIASGGGSAFTGMEIANILRGIETDVECRNLGAAMSAAAMIFLAGDTRLVGKAGTATMFHEARGFLDIFSFGTASELEQIDVQKAKAREIDLLKTLNKTILKMLTDVAGMKPAKAKEIVEAEKQLTNEEALELGNRHRRMGEGRQEGYGQRGRSGIRSPIRRACQAGKPCACACGIAGSERSGSQDRYWRYGIQACREASTKR